MNDKYCVYMTVICDVTLKLPTFYIGSSSVERVNNGYHGSVSSKKYEKLFKKFCKTNPNDISTHILSYHDTDIEARAAELALQKEHKVVKHESFVNLSFAAPHGYFGMDTTGIPKSEEHKNKIKISNTGKTKSAETKEKISLKLKGITHSEERKAYQSEKQKGREVKEETRIKLRNANTGENNPRFGTTQKRVICEHCGKDVPVNIYARCHGDKCKLK